MCQVFLIKIPIVQPQLFTIPFSQNCYLSWKPVFSKISFLSVMATLLESLSVLIHYPASSRVKRKNPDLRSEIQIIFDMITQ